MDNVGMATPSFSPALFSFLEDLAEHNDRAWFKANRRRYEECVQEPAVEFVSEFAPRLRGISPHLVADARPVGGSLFRIQRDTRFSKDKTPYKTNLGITFRHEQTGEIHAPGYYLHLEPGSVFTAAGVWHPSTATLTSIRDAIAARPDEWAAAAHRGSFAAAFRLGGDSLVRPPRGYDPDHPMLADLKRKEFIGVATLTEDETVAPGFADAYARLCADAAPLMRFLSDAVGVPF
jgi:uncharacterized protein (TIGR02453 family)